MKPIIDTKKWRNITVTELFKTLGLDMPRLEFIPGLSTY